MPETIEETLEDLPMINITLDPWPSIAVFALATYGTYALARKTAAKSEQMWINWKIKKDNKKAVEANNPPSQ